ncbi:MAG: aspartate--tRNA ligase [Actinomycetota bacterium]
MEGPTEKLLLGAMRSHACGHLRAGDVGTQVRLGGWVHRRRDHGGVIFLDLRDASGLVQVVIDPEQISNVGGLRSEACIAVTGTVRRRPEGNENPRIPTGEVEVAASKLEVLSESDTPPFPIETRSGIDEATRLRYRYLDLRRPEALALLRLRHKANTTIRRVLESRGFLEVETPMLTRSTPEGARDFLVPSRLQPGSFYALPQSPQLFKQILMVSGVERYYQIVRCFRDEDLRSDRQPEFTQLDVEVSFAVEEDIFALMEELLATVWREALDLEIVTPFPRMRYAEVIARYGSDKPDLRFGMEIGDLSEVLSATSFPPFVSTLLSGGAIRAICLPEGASLSRKAFDAWETWAKTRGLGGLAWGAVETEGMRGPLAKALSEEEKRGLTQVTGAAAGDAVFVAAGPEKKVAAALGELRVSLAKERGLIPDNRWEFLWVVEPPLFEWDDEAGRWDAVHHPFTSPSEACEAGFDAAPGAAIARAYDVVLNGVELGGGSIRIHRRAVQRRAFDVLGIEEAEAEEKFGFLLRAFDFGPPPHGGIALGLDRLVMLMGEAFSLRDVIAFPKTQSGVDLMTQAPSPVSTAQLTELRLRALPAHPDSAKS